jgi:menaquinone-specific isochorismate synthase
MNQDPVVQKFSRIFHDKSNFIFSESGKHILSYRFSLSDIDFDRLVNATIAADATAFYFQKPAENVRFLAIGRVLSVRSGGDERFADLNRAYSDLQPLIVQQYNGSKSVPLPLFVGSMSFFPDHPDPLWKDFSPSDWFIPEFIITPVDNDCYVAFQVDFGRVTGSDHCVPKLEKFIASLRSNTSPVSGPISAYRRDYEPSDKEEWMKTVGSVIESIRRNEVNKVVLSRYITIDGLDATRVTSELIKAARIFPECYIFMYKSGNSLFFGISPEKLASFHGKRVHCHAIAGSIARGKNDEDDERLGRELLESEKNLIEHRIVVDHIKSVLNRHCSSVTIDRFPKLKKLSYIQHLYIAAHGTLHPGVSMLRVLEDLHPTPAVGGYPLVPALKMIRSMEKYDRGLYTGFLGWFDANGNGDFCVALRSALLNGSTLHAFAGGGIVADSKPEDEYDETEIKLKAITSLLHP